MHTIRGKSKSRASAGPKGTPVAKRPTAKAGACEACGELVSFSAFRCPNCGHMARGRRWQVQLVGLVVVVLVAGFFVKQRLDQQQHDAKVWANCFAERGASC